MRRFFALGAALAIAIFLNGCGASSNYVVVDESLTPSAAAPESEPTAEPESPLVDAAPEITPEAAPERVAPKFADGGKSVDFTDVPALDGFYAADAPWDAVKVVRGKGALTAKTLRDFAKLPQLTEFLWTDAQFVGVKAEDFAGLAAAKNLKKARLTQLRDESGAFPGFALAALASAPALVDLDVSGSPLTANDLAAVDWAGGFAKLTRLNLYQTKTADAGVDALAPLAGRLTWLNLDDAGVSAVSAEKIAKFSQLTFLHVGRSKMDDAAILQFASLAKLEKIHVTRSLVTEAGADALRAKLPNCVVVSQPEN